MSVENMVSPTIETKVIKVVRQVLSVGIDVSKLKLDVALIFEDQSSVAKVFDNDSKGIKSLMTFLKKQETTKAVPCVIESTGNYHIQSTLMITQAGFSVKLINPLITKKYQKSSVRNAKSDPIDAKRLAQIGILEPELPVFNTNIDIVRSKKLISYLNSLEKTKQQLKRSMNQLKETEKYLGKLISLNHINKVIVEIESQIKLLKDAICNTAPKEAKELALACKGLSVEKASIIFCMLCDKDFSTRDQLVAFVGYDIASRKSGKWQGKEKLSKRGEPIIRKILFQIAWGLKQHNPIFKEYYDRLKKEGKHYTATLVAVARKFLKFLFAFYWKKTIIFN